MVKKQNSKKKPKISAEKSQKVGRPTDYKIEFNEQARKLCLLGATDIELADFFEISHQTLNTWKNIYPKFLESIKEGKEQADANVANRLYQRAMGYEHDDVEVKVVSAGAGLGSEVKKVPIKRIYPPETTAAIFWLKNRQKEKWRDKQDINVSGSLQTMSDDELDAKLNALLNKDKNN